MWMQNVQTSKYVSLEFCGSFFFSHSNNMEILYFSNKFDSINSTAWVGSHSKRSSRTDYRNRNSALRSYGNIFPFKKALSIFLLSCLDSIETYTRKKNVRMTFKACNLLLTSFSSRFSSINNWGQPCNRKSSLQMLNSSISNISIRAFNPLLLFVVTREPEYTIQWALDIISHRIQMIQ